MLTPQSCARRSLIKRRLRPGERGQGADSPAVQVDVGIAVDTDHTPPWSYVLHVDLADLWDEDPGVSQHVRIVEVHPRPNVLLRADSLGLGTVDENLVITPPVARHLAVVTLQPVLLDLCYPPDHLPAGSAERRFSKTIFLELVSSDWEASGHILHSLGDFGGTVRRLVLLHADHEGKGAPGREVLVVLLLGGRPSVHALLQGGDVHVQVGHGEVGRDVGVVVDGELEIDVLRQVGNLYEDVAPVRTVGGDLVLLTLLASDPLLLHGVHRDDQVRPQLRAQVRPVGAGPRKVRGLDICQENLSSEHLDVIKLNLNCTANCDWVRYMY